MTLYGYIRTSRHRVQGEAGSDPDTQQLQLLDAGVDQQRIYRDVGVSGTKGTASGTAWRELDRNLAAIDIPLTRGIAVASDQ